MAPVGNLNTMDSGSAQLARQNRVQQRLVTLFDETDVQAVILRGLAAHGKDGVLHGAVDELHQLGTILPVWLDLSTMLNQPRADFIRRLATSIVAVTKQNQALLHQLTPTEFHTTFMAQILQELPPATALLFVFDGLDFAERKQVSKVNNLILPLLRRLAQLTQLRFLLVVERGDAATIQPLLHPIFTSVEEIALLESTPPLVLDPLPEQATLSDPLASDSAQRVDAGSSKRRIALLAMLILIISVLLVNIYLLLFLSDRLLGQ